MPSAANAKSEKPASAEATDNSPVRQIMTIIEHKIRNLEKRKSKLTSYRDLQKAGKDLNSDQKVAVAKYDEVAQTLEFARDLSKQVASIATATEREAKKQAKKEAWVRYAADTAKIREVLLILDCLVQMGSSEAREDFLNGSNGACKLTEHDLKVLDDLYPEVTPKHEPNEEGQPGFAAHTARAAEHLCAIVDGRPRDALGTTYTRIKEVIGAVHQCGYFDRGAGGAAGGAEPAEEDAPEQEVPEAVGKEVEGEPYASSAGAPVAAAGAGAGAGEPLRAAAGAAPAPYPLCALPPITLQEVEHAYFAQQYAAAQRPLAEVIGSQNFFFLQESELDSPTGTPAPLLASPPHPPHAAPLPIPSQTFTNQHFVALRPELPPPPHFPPPPDHFPPPPHAPLPAQLPPHAASPAPPAAPESAPAPESQPQPEERKPSPADERKEDEWRPRSPEREEGGDRRAQGQGDGQRRYRRYPRPPPNGYRGRGSYAPRPDRQDRQDRPERQERDRAERADYHPREYTQGRKDDRYRQDGPRYNDRDNYQGRHKDSYRGSSDAYYGNGDAGEPGEEHAGGYKGRGARARPRPAHAPRPRPAYPRKPDGAAPSPSHAAHVAPRDE